jgi:RND family efflux transporter MFP subunit
VTVVRPQQAPLAEQLRLSGTLTADRSAELSPRVDGLVARLRVDAGDVVKRGQVLMDLDATVAQLALERARAGTAEAAVQETEAQRLVDEARRLVAERHLPATELARREAAAKLAAASLDAARAAQREQEELVRRHQLPAPFDGVVARRLVDVGEWVVRGSPVFELVAVDRVRLDVQAPQESFGRITADAEVRVQSSLEPGEPFRGRVAARVPVGDGATRTLLVRIIVDGAAGRLLPGTSATALIDLPSTGSALLVPRDALLRYPDGTLSVFAIDESGGQARAVEKKVRIGRSGELVEVVEGLSPGERVVVRGNETLRSGQAVRITGVR